MTHKIRVEVELIGAVAFDERQRLERRSWVLIGG